jgi:hypothetical protein
MNGNDNSPNRQIVIAFLQTLEIVIAWFQKGPIAFVCFFLGRYLITKVKELKVFVGILDPAPLTWKAIADKKHLA